MQKFKITFLPEGKVVEVDPSDNSEASLLDIAMDAGVDIDHACGGVCACSTCHLIVQEGAGSLNASSEDEDDQLEEAPGLTTRSRLACQCIPNGKGGDIVVQIPSWNRNLVRE